MDRRRGLEDMAHLGHYKLLSRGYAQRACVCVCDRRCDCHKRPYIIKARALFWKQCGAAKGLELEEWPN